MNCIKCKVYLTEEEERQYKNHCKVCYRKENGLCVKCGKILDKFQLVNGYYKCFLVLHLEIVNVKFEFVLCQSRK